MNHRRILIVDDNRAIHDDFRKILRGGEAVSELESALFGNDVSSMPTFELTSAYQGAAGVEAVRAACAAKQPFALALVDVRMPPGLDGVETVARMWEVDPDLQIVICTAFSDTSWTDIMKRFGTTDRLLILKKPFDLVEVCQLALALTEKWRLAHQARSRMADLVKSRADLAASLALERAVQEATEDGLLVVGSDRRVSTANRRFLGMWHIPAAIWETRDDDAMLRFVVDQLEDPDAFIGRVVHLYDHPHEAGSDEIRLRDGRVFERWTGPVRDTSGEVHGRLWWFRDITERRKLEIDRAVVTERMTSMGRLAAGVGHEINNPLTYALSNVERLLGELDTQPREAVLESLRETHDGLCRIRVIVKDLQTLARSEEDHGVVDLVGVVERAIQIAGAELRHRAPIVRRYAPVRPVEGNATRLGQVFLNLIVNAAHAIPMGQAANHRVEIVMRSSEDHAIVEVTDTGCGIAPEHLERIFDPFFTTKEIGVGTGLGLPISREIVRNHRGTLSVTSKVGVGTTMTVTLPHATATTNVLPVQPIQTSVHRGRVLVIDDEPLIARTLEKSLRAHHDVVTASQASDALAYIRDGQRFDLILCDLMMPDVSGIDVHEYLSREHPTVVSRLVFMTGGAFTAKAKAFLASVPNERIDKPFSIAELNRVVGRYLAS